MAEPQSTLNIPKEVIAPIIEAHISAAIAKALSSPDALVAEAVTRCLNLKVSASGTISSYSSENKFSWLDWQIGTTIRTAAKAAIDKAIEAQQGRIEEQIAKQLADKRNPLVKQLVSAMLASLKPESLKYRLKIEGVEPQ